MAIYRYSSFSGHLQNKALATSVNHLPMLDIPAGASDTSCLYPTLGSSLKVFAFPCLAHLVSLRHLSTRSNRFHSSVVRLAIGMVNCVLPIPSMRLPNLLLKSCSGIVSPCNVIPWLCNSCNSLQSCICTIVAGLVYVSNMQPRGIRQSLRYQVESHWVFTKLVLPCFHMVSYCFLNAGALSQRILNISVPFWFPSLFQVSKACQLHVPGLRLFRSTQPQHRCIDVVTVTNQLAPRCQHQLLSAGGKPTSRTCSSIFDHLIGKDWCSTMFLQQRPKRLQQVKPNGRTWTWAHFNPFSSLTR